ncbi:MAG TPA: serine/threonine-protein kinase [Bryobacteraceae bacterium]|nr:serine/threonine-protein kinase [Bryobacteraceae bacterium]
MDLNVGQLFGDYTVARVLSADNMGRVYQVEHRLTKRREAMKVLPADLASDTQVKRFEREMRALARLHHPNIAALYNAAHSKNELILFMELVEGQTLESLLAGGGLPIETGAAYIQQILLALDYAHQQGVVHRDVTPAHVIVTPAGQVKLTDFGLAKSFGDPLLTNCGEILGSLPYLAPERLKGATHPDRRSDLYSTGAILYEHLTGKKPFGSNRRLAPVLTDSEAEPSPPSQIDPSLAPEWDEILRRALARDPANRYQSAGEFIEALARLDPTPSAGFFARRMSPLIVGLAVSGLTLALAATPAIERFASAAPAVLRASPLHIAPPDFALTLPAHSYAAVVHHPRLPPHPDHLTAGQTDPPPKKGFWSKLNIFKRRASADQ